MKKLVLPIVSLLMWLIFANIQVDASELPNTVTTNHSVVSYSLSDDNNGHITPLANITGWRFKNINGHAYKRLYDYTAQKWIGNWIKV